MRRKDRLDAFCEGNQWIRPFYTEHTFEVAFITENNSREVIGLLGDIFETAAAINRSKSRLSSDDLGESGKEILRLAKKVGKGWFALLLSENLEVDTEIPPYIIEAIGFASADNVGPSIFRKIIEYRISQGLFDEDERRAFLQTDGLQEMNDPDYVSSFVELLPGDPLSRLVEQVGEIAG